MVNAGSFRDGTGKNLSDSVNAGVRRIFRHADCDLLTEAQEASRSGTGDRDEQRPRSGCAH
jgi:hypothetical protein